jgi:hypothetical protein
MATNVFLRTGSANFSRSGETRRTMTSWRCEAHLCVPDLMHDRKD